jgi:hypothetical protein
MSYARFSDADVYVFLNIFGYLECCGCALPESDFVQTPLFLTTKDMISHLERHKEVGHSLGHCIERLKEDQQENDGWMAKVAAGMCCMCTEGNGKCSQPHSKDFPDIEGPCYSCQDTLVCNYCGGTGKRNKKE